MKIQKIEIPKGLFLAPMAGVTDHAFRMICKMHGAEYMTTEMVSAKAIHFGDAKTSILAGILREEQPCAVQIFGSEPDIMAEAAVRLMEMSVPPTAIDINMGCPMTKITSNGEGAALMRKPVLAGKIVAAVKAAVSVPVTVKFRTGWDEHSVTASDFAARMEAEGADAICIHGRTRAQLYADPVDYRTIEEVKKSVHIPVIGNGGVRCASDAERMFETGVDGIAVGRGAMGNPWLFEELAAMMEGREYRYPSVCEKLELAKQHLELLIKDKGEFIGIREGRRQISYYIAGIPGAAEARGKINACAAKEEMLSVLYELAKRQKTEERS